MYDPIAIAWLAGLLEGEGSFFLKRGVSPIITMQMTDQDIIERVQSIFGGKVYLSNPAQEHYKEVWAWNLLTPREDVVSLMSAVLPHMGIRRANKIRECIRIGAEHQKQRQENQDQIDNKRRLIKAMYAEDRYTHQEIADHFGYERSYVSHILRGKYDKV